MYSSRFGAKATLCAYSRNKRGIAGNLIWINFDRHALLNLFHKAQGYYVADADEIRPQYSLDASDANVLFASSIVRNSGLSVGEAIDKLDSQVSDIYGLHEKALPSYSDQVLPFDVTLAGANEYGAMCAAKILGVETWSLRPSRQQSPRASREGQRCPRSPPDPAPEPSRERRLSLSKRKWAVLYAERKVLYMVFT